MLADSISGKSGIRPLSSQFGYYSQVLVILLNTLEYLVEKVVA